jgi:hypothetical protein
MTFDDWRKEVGKWINRLHFKTSWTKYINDEMSYEDYKEYCFITVNSIREAMGNPAYSEKKFDEAWQYRILAHEKYSVTFDELVNVIFGWW